MCWDWDEAARENEEMLADEEAEAYEEAQANAERRARELLEDERAAPISPEEEAEELRRGLEILEERNWML